MHYVSEYMSVILHWFDRQLATMSTDSEKQLLVASTSKGSRRAVLWEQGRLDPLQNKHFLENHVLCSTEAIQGQVYYPLELGLHHQTQAACCQHAV